MLTIAGLLRAPLVRRALLAFALLSPAIARAQMGASTDIITGTVIRAETNTPLEGAAVEVTSIESNVTRRARTNAAASSPSCFQTEGASIASSHGHSGSPPRQ